MPDRSEPQPTPGLGLCEARAVGQRLAREESQRLGFVVSHEIWLFYTPSKAMFRYGITSDRDIRARGGGTQIWFDANTGALLRTVLPSGQHSGNTITNWLFSLHMAQVGALPFRLLGCVSGVGVAMLSVTGVVIWWRKRAERVKAARRAAAARPAVEPIEAAPTNAVST